jgi:hypothetical protein
MMNLKSASAVLVMMTTILLLMVHVPATAQTSPALHKKVARDTLQKIPAGLYRYNSKAEIGCLFDSKRAGEQSKEYDVNELMLRT